MNLFGVLLCAVILRLLLKDANEPMIAKRAATQLVAGLIIIIGLVVWLAPNGPAATTPRLSQRVFWYPQAEVQQDIACGGTVPAAASAVYVEISETQLGVTSQQLVNGVRLNGTLLWQQEGDVTLRYTLGRNTLALYYQRIVGSGVYSFRAQVGGSQTECSVLR